MQDTAIKPPHRSADSSPAIQPASAVAGAALLCVLSMSSVQFGAALSAPTMATYGALSTTWLRLCWAALVLAVVVRPRLFSYSRAHWLAAGALGATMAGMTLCFFSALQRIPLGLAVAIDFLGPLTVATLAVRRARAMLWPLLAIAGVVLLSRDGGGWIGEPVGVLMACGAALGWGSYILLMKKTGTLFKGLEGLSVSLIAAALVATPFGLANSGVHIAPAQIAATAGLALLVPLLPYALEMIALRHMPSASFGILMSVEPAIGALAGFIVLHQPMGMLQILGTLLVVSASVGAVVAAR
ncbi:inner membrane transporter RhtA [Paraburkholderia sp. GAS199]|uniref:EamA family transporter n=1 Tax=Paraburkholderia sp. GAS199 TaxID=3035126 RepID=UPI003D205364